MKRRQRFLTWAQKDTEDTRKINYEIHKDGEVYHYTSEDEVSRSFMIWLQRYAMIDSLELINNEWFIKLS